MRRIRVKLPSDDCPGLLEGCGRSQAAMKKVRYERIICPYCGKYGAAKEKKP